MALLLVTFLMAWVMARGAVRRSRRPGVPVELALLRVRRSGASLAGMSVVLGFGAVVELLVEIPPLVPFWWVLCAVVPLVARLGASILWLDQVVEAVGALRGVAVDRDRAFLVGLRAVLVRLVPQQLLVGLVAWLTGGDAPVPVIGAVLVGFGLLNVVLGPWLLRLAVATRPADAAEQARVDQVSERFQLNVGPVLVVEPGPLGAVNGFVVGIGPSGSRVHLTAPLLARFGDDELAAVLAHEVGHRELRHLTTRVIASLATSLGVLALVTLIAAGESGALPLVLLTALLLLGPTLRLRLVGGLSVRQELAADAFAAARVGPLRMRSALEALFADNRLPRQISPRQARKQGHPSLRQRLDQLAAMDDLEQAAPQG